MNKSDKFKQLQSKVIEDKTKNEFYQKEKDLEFQETRKQESIKNAINDYPVVLKKFEECILDGKTKMRIYNHQSCYNSYHGDEHYNNKMAELLEKDGFIVEWEHSDGWEESDVSCEQKPFDSIVFYCA